MNLDLHGKTWTEAQADFIEVYNKILGQSHRETLDVVHGYGSTGQGGVIRGRLRAYLDRYPHYLTYKTGEDVDGNPGHTIVTPVKRFPALDDQLGEEVWNYCSEPRTMSKIMGKFRKHGDPTVQRAVDKLVSQHRLLRMSDKVSRP
ncbi:MAG: hypothetical protein EXR47_05475 [Dehalococcoidia bacterium]|nr:hypothetical protein [Dehalococcoidia bacterium]